MHWTRVVGSGSGGGGWTLAWLPAASLAYEALVLQSVSALISIETQVNQLNIDGENGDAVNPLILHSTRVNWGR